MVAGRVALAIVVFAVSFGLGIGGTYLLIRQGGDSAAGGETTAEASSTPAPPERRPPEDAAAATPSAAGPAAAPAPDVAADAAADSAAAGTAIAVAPEPSSPNDLAEEDTPEPEGEPDVATAVAADSPTPPPSPAAGWNDLVGRRCQLGLEEVGFSSLSLREGSITHEQLVDWDKDFSRNRRLAVLRAADAPKVEVLAFGVDAEGLPTAAHVKVVGSQLQGVIAVYTEGKRVPLRPLER